MTIVFMCLAGGTAYADLHVGGLGHAGYRDVLPGGGEEPTAESLHSAVARRSRQAELMTRSLFSSFQRIYFYIVSSLSFVSLFVTTTDFTNFKWGFCTVVLINLS